MTQPQPHTLTVYVGTYTKASSQASGEAKGVYLYRLSLADGALEWLDLTPDLVNPAYLALDPQRRYLYAVSEVTEFEGDTGGGISAFTVDQSTGRLTALNSRRTHGTVPCYVTVDATGRWVLTTNYGDGSVAVLPAAPDGSLGPPLQLVQHAGASVHPERQAGPHAHSVVLDPAQRYALVADLGMDKIMVYRLDADNDTVTLQPVPSAATHPGAGPRHLAFHPSGAYLYCANELDSTVTAFRYDPATGGLAPVQTLSALPADFTDVSYCAHIVVSPSGDFLYVSNRGHDSLAIFAIDSATGALTAIDHAPTLGHFPRHFAIDPTGALLLAANQLTDTIVSFRIDPTTGRLTPLRTTFVPTPVCVLITDLTGSV